MPKRHIPIKYQKPLITKDNTIPRVCGIGIIAALVGWITYRHNLLTGVGAIAAALIGFIVAFSGGWQRGVAMIGFFVSSAALSRLGRRSDQMERHSDGPRNAAQVLANGAVPAMLSLLENADKSRTAYFGSLAAVNGDTWATEIGKLSTSSPRHILTLKPVPTGTSGAVTVPGTLASVGGGLFISLISVLLNHRNHRVNRDHLIISGMLAGTFGSFVDTLIGATIQERRFCEQCMCETEASTHHCGCPTKHSGGVAGVNNEVVNFCCSCAGALVGWIVPLLSQRIAARR